MTSRPSLVSWLASHLKRSRIAKVAMLSFVVIAAGIVGVALAPVSETLRVFLILLAGLGVVVVSGLYLAYRTLGFARRVSEENLAIRASLAHMTADLERRGFAITSDARQLIDAFERRTEAERAEVGRLRIVVPQLQADVNSIQALAAKIATRNDAFDIRLSATTSALERMQNSIAPELASALDDLRRHDLEARRHLDNIAERLDAVVTEAAAHGKQIGGLAAAHGDAVRLAGEVLTARDMDREFTVRLQREVLVLAEVSASAQERAGVLAEQIADAAARIQGLNEFRNRVERDLSAIAMDVSAAVQRSSMQDRQLQEFRKAFDAEGNERYEQITAEVRQLHVASQEASAAALLALENRQQSLDDQAAEAGRQISSALAGIDELREGQGSIQAETARLASVSTKSAVLLDQLPEQLRTTREDLRKVAAVADECALQLASSSKQIEEAAVSFNGFSEATRTQFEIFGTGLRDAGAKTDAALAAVDRLRLEIDAANRGIAEARNEISVEIASLAASTDELRDKQASGFSRLANIEASLKGVETKADATVAAGDQLRLDVDAASRSIATVRDEISAQIASVAASTDELRDKQASGLSRLANIEAGLKGVEAKADAGLTAGDQLRLDVDDASRGLVEARDGIAAELASLSASTNELRDQQSSNSLRFEKIDSSLKDVETKADAAVAAGDRLRLEVDAANRGVADVRGEVAEVRNLHTEGAGITKALTERSEETARLAARTAGELEDLVALTKGLQSDQAASQGLLTDRLDEVVSELAGMQRTLDQRVSELTDRLTTLKTEADKDANAERITKIEANIVDLVRLVDEAEIALADEVTRLASTISALVEDQKSFGADSIAAPAGSDTEDHGADRLAEVEKGLAQLARLVNDSEIATVAELTQLSSVVRELEEVRGPGQLHTTGGDATELEGLLRSRLQNAASQLEAAVRDTERALSELGGVSVGPQSSKPSRAAGVAKRKAPSKPSARSQKPSAKPQAARGSSKKRKR
jgi:chromosome segregation ATPase